MASYVLNDSTIEILKNFANINNQVVFKAGSAQRACNDTRNFIADAELNEPFPRECALYELGRLLGIIDACKTNTNTLPTIVFGPSSLVVKHDYGKVTIPYAHADVISAPPGVQFYLKKSIATFDLTESLWTKIKHTASWLQATSLYIIINTGGELVLKLVNERDKGGDASGSASYNMPNTHVQEAVDNTWAVKFDTLKLISGNYTVEVGQVGNSNGTTLFGMFFKLNDPTKKVTYLTSGHVVKTRD
jgi:hypothetical protein